MSILLNNCSNSSLLNEGHLFLFGCEGLSFLFAFKILTLLEFASGANLDGTALAIVITLVLLL